MATGPKTVDPLLEEEVQKTEFKQTKYRWVILIGCMFCIFNNTVSVATLSPVAIQISEAYELSSVTIVNLCAISFSLCAAPFTFLCIIALGKFKMSTVMRFASLIQLIGMLVRDMSMVHDKFWPLLFGVFL